jgi:hypothetical protein
MKRTIAVALIGLSALAAACTNKQGETEAPVFITVEIASQPGFVDISVPQAVLIGEINLVSHFKRADSTDPNGFANVTIENYSVAYRRTDGGTIVPPTQSFGGGGFVPSGGSATLSDYPVMYASAVQGTPFDQLLPFNGGVDRQTGKTEIDTAFDITFFGHTASGMRVQSETASGILIFRYGSAAVAGARAGK